MIDASNPDVRKLVEAYQSKDWKTVVAIADTLYDEIESPDIARLYAEALAATDNSQKAIAVLERQIAKHPDDYYLYQTKGNVCFVAGSLDSAIANYDKVIAIRPTYARPYMYEGEIYEAKGDTANAIARYLSAARLFAENNFAAETVEYCKRILLLDSDNTEAKQLLKQFTR